MKYIYTGQKIKWIKHLLHILMQADFIRDFWDIITETPVKRAPRNNFSKNTDFFQ